MCSVSLGGNRYVAVWEEVGDLALSVYLTSGLFGCPSREPQCTARRRGILP